MTADAKVGLLLGLVFIVVIALVVNGLPDFVQTAKSKGIVETSITTQTGTDLVIDPAVVDVARSLQPARTIRYTEPPAEVVVLDGSPAASQEDSEPIAAAVDEKTDMVIVPPKPEVAVVETAAPKTPLQEQASAAAQKTVKQIEQAQQTESIQPAAKQVSGQAHVVQKGETLAVIAKKYYGPEVGNKLATIDMLYEANKSTLESPEKVRIGQKLVIPNVKMPVAAPAQQKPAQDKTLMERFKDMLEPAGKNDKPALEFVKTGKNDAPAAVQTKTADKKPALVKVAPPAKPEVNGSKSYVEYTVQDGDRLMKIAERTLGDSSRADEIAKLNNLSNPNSLKVGTKLKIPK